LEGEFFADGEGVLNAVVEVGETHKGIEGGCWLWGVGCGFEWFGGGDERFFEGRTSEAGVDTIGEVQEDAVLR